jgi:hypothetical protein
MADIPKDASVFITDGEGVEGGHGPRLTNWRDAAFEQARVSNRRKQIIRKLVRRHSAARTQIQQTRRAMDVQLSFIETLLSGRKQTCDD